MLAVSIMLLCVRTARGQADSQRTCATLCGLKGVCVFVDVQGVTPEAEQVGFTRHRIQTDVELRLRRSRIRATSPDDAIQPIGVAALNVTVMILKRSLLDVDSYVYRIDVELHQAVRLVRDPEIVAPAQTWQATPTVGIVGKARIRSIRESVDDAVDEFINAYLAVNPLEPTSKPAKP